MDKHSGYQEEDFSPFMSRDKRPSQLPPNLKLLEGPEREKALYYLASHRGKKEHVMVRINPQDHGTEWASVFHLSSGMSDSPDGRGYIMVPNWHGGPDKITADIYYFAICEHEQTEEGHRPNHSRGWHPGHCKKCGLDMTIDSGD